MKLVILDGGTVNPGDLSWHALEEWGTLTVYHTTPPNDLEEIIRRIGDSDIVITNKTPVTAAVLDACPKVRFVSVLGTGYNVIDTECCRQRGIPVSNIPGYGTATVSQYTIGLLLELCHHAVRRSDAVHQGRWTTGPDSCYWDYSLTELCGKTLGIIGFGQIGRQVGRIAAALGMRVLAYSRSENEEGRAIGTYVSLETLLRESDVISLHCPLFPETRGIISRESLQKMKDGVLLVNTSRGPLVDDAALAEALRSGKVAGAALDVVSVEPILPDNPLLSAPNCLITPHIAWTSPEARKRVLDATIENVSAFLAGSPIHVVNP